MIGKYKKDKCMSGRFLNPDTSFKRNRIESRHFLKAQGKTDFLKNKVYMR